MLNNGRMWSPLRWSRACLVSPTLADGCGTGQEGAGRSGRSGVRGPGGGRGGRGRLDAAEVEAFLKAEIRGRSRRGTCSSPRRASGTLLPEPLTLRLDT